GAIVGWAALPGATGRRGMLGISYFGWIQQQVAAITPPSLKAIFAPYASTDFYRDVFYHGGILAHGFLIHWSRRWDNPRTASWYRERLGEEAYRAAIARALRDEDLMAVPELRQALERPEQPRSTPAVD